jgi:hypothetical protein
MRPPRPTQTFVSLLLCITSIWSTTQASSARGHHHGDHHGHHHEARAEDLTKSNPTLGDNSTLLDPGEMIRKALAALSVINKARVEHPDFNKEEFDQKPGPVDIAPPLDYRAGAAINGTLNKRSTNSSLSRQDILYSIPTELAEAAKFLAESTAQVPSGEHEDVAREYRQKYALKTNDTNIPVSLTTPEGLLGTFASNDSTSSSGKRATYGYWMADIKHQAFMPYAPSGYKVRDSILGGQTN